MGIVVRENSTGFHYKSGLLALVMSSKIFGNPANQGRIRPLSTANEYVERHHHKWVDFLKSSLRDTDLRNQPEIAGMWVHTC
jgi:hypothetical protein